jgi:hypothetical protein
MNLDELERDGWEQVDTFGNDCVIMALDEQRIVVDQSGNIVIRYEKTD